MKHAASPLASFGDGPRFGTRGAFLLRRLRSATHLFFDRVYAHRHPGPLGRAVIGALRPLTIGTVNDRWSLGVHLPRWLETAHAPPFLPLPSGKRIFMFCAYRGQFSHDLALACLLAWRGHRITFGYLPKLRSPSKRPMEDHGSAVPYLHALLDPVARLTGGKIRCIDLSAAVRGDEPIDDAFVKKQSVGDVVMALKRETLDMAAPEVAGFFRYYTAIGEAAQRAARRHFAAHAADYDLCLVANGSTFEGAHFCQVAREAGIPLNTYEKFAFRDVRVMNHGDDFRAFHDLDLAWRLRGAAGYTDQPFFSRAVARARRLIDERRRSSTATWAWKLQAAPEQSADQALRELGLAPDLRFALVCTNVPYDAGYDRLTRFYPSMRAWLVETVRRLLERTDIHVIVRAHPAESAHYGGHERSEDNLAAAGLLNHPRLTMIPADRAINTYGLMERCHFGAVFSSTTGLELAMLGKLAAVGADVYYRGRGFTVDSESATEYADNLVEIANRQGRPALEEQQRADAAMFHFILHFVMQWPYPYDKPSSVVRRPPQDLVRDPALRAYLPTLDVLALTREEWEEGALGYLAAAGDNHVGAVLRDDA